MNLNTIIEEATYKNYSKLLYRIKGKGEVKKQMPNIRFLLTIVSVMDIVNFSFFFFSKDSYLIFNGLGKAVL